MFHAQKIPLVSQPDHLMRRILKQRDIAYERDRIDEYVTDLRLDTIRKNSLNAELEWVESQIDSPLCFVHNDFRKPNIMVLDDHEVGANRVLFCDFEGSGNGYRGRDFGTFFVDWDRKVPEDYRRVVKFPDDSVIQPFIDQYILESIALRSVNFLTDKRNSVKHILKETKVFALIALLHMMTACLYIEYKGVDKSALMVRLSSSRSSVV